jgi:hypothetical protein
MLHTFLEIPTCIVSTVLAQWDALVKIIDRKDASLTFQLLIETVSVSEIVCFLF